MAQSPVQQTINTFVGGLVTEATELTFPENASVDELNCELLINGSRRRRKGIQIQEANTPSSYSVSSEEYVIHTYSWDNVNEMGELSFLILQVGSQLYFYEKSGYPVSANKHSFSYNLQNASAANGLSISSYPFQAAVVLGDLVVVSPGIDAIIISYNDDTDQFSVEKLPKPKVRDFEWQGDTEGYFQNESSPNSRRKYDTYNAGWYSPQLNKIREIFNVWPNFGYPWHAFRDTNQNRDLSEGDWFDATGSTTLTGNGRFILDLFSKDRTKAVKEAEGVNLGLPVERVRARFSTTATFGGRAWFSGLGDQNIYFSKIIEDTDDITKFYQVNDPTAFDFSDLLDSDGGVVKIPEARNVRKLYVFGSSLLVFAENGIWEISGPDNVFKATEFSVNKVSGVGIVNDRSFVDVEGAPFWWDKFGIYTAARGQVSLRPQIENISRTTIQTFFDNIPTASKLSAVGVYNSHDKTISWLYSTDQSNPLKYNGVLNLSVPLKAYYPWKFSDQDTDTKYVVGAEFFPGYTNTEVDIDVIDSDGNTVTNTAGDQVITTGFSIDTSTDPRVIYVVKDSGTNKISFADTNQEIRSDWDTNETYESYAEAAYSFFGNASLDKKGLEVTAYMRVTETGWTGDENTGYTPVNPSSLKMKTYWDLGLSSNVDAQELYRMRHYPVVDPTNLSEFGYPASAVITNTSVRGSGRVLKLRFESTDDKDFHLLGYEFIGLQSQGL